MANKNTINANFIQIFVNNQLVANSDSCDLDAKRNTRKTTTKDDNVNGFNRYEPTDGDITISGSYLKSFDANTLSTEELIDLLRVNQKVTFRYGGTTSGQKYRTGTGILTNVKESAKLNESVTGSYTINVDGDLSAPITIP